MKKLSIIIAMISLLGLNGCRCLSPQTTLNESHPKYVFYFIGDGMGMNQVVTTQMYLAELQGKIGVAPLSFTDFPVRNYITTYSELNGVTCSAAAGTALATGSKTRNGMLGMDKDSVLVNSVAYYAKKAGHKVAILTSVGMNHATPAAFYAHQPGRNMYHEIALDAAAAGFDLYGGGGALHPVKDGKNALSTLRDSGYIIALGVEAFEKAAALGDNQKILFMNDTLDYTDATLKYSIDQRQGDLKLAEMTRPMMEYLERTNREGFFMMVEGGKIDYACHSNDARTTFDETVDFSEAVAVALDFYHRHPEETLIVVTADHETGGIVPGTGGYSLNLQILKNQKVSINGLTALIKKLRHDNNNQVKWEQIKQLLKENMGFWDEIKLSEFEESALKERFKKDFTGTTVEMEKSLYATSEPIAKQAIQILNKMAKIGWTSGGHSAGLVPVYAIGAGSELFMGELDNTDIPKRIARAAGYAME